MKRDRKQKAGIFGCIVLLMFFLLTGCGKDSEVQIVAPKEVKNEEDQTNHLGTDLKKQLEAPEKIQETLLENEKFVTIQAEVEVPEVSEILLKKVEERQIANEDLKTVQSVLFLGESLYYPDNNLGYVGGCATKEEFEKRIEQLKNLKPKTDEQKTRVEERLEMFESMMDDVPDDVKMEEIPLEIKEYEKTETQPGDTEIEVDDAEKLQNSAEEFEETQSDLYGYIRRDGAVCELHARNGVDVSSILEISKVNGFWTDSMDVEEERVEEVPGNPKDVRNQAEQLKNDLGFSDFSCFYQRETNWYDPNALDGMGGVRKLDLYYYTRNIQNVSVNMLGEYVYERGGEDSGTELVIFGFSSEGLEVFQYRDPMEVSDYSSQPVFLLPFSEVMENFRSNFVKNLESSSYLQPWGEIMEDNAINITISRISLGYARIWSEDTQGYLLTPVWDFYGTCSLTEEGKETYGIEGSEELRSWMTINAMDGSIVPRYY